MSTTMKRRSAGLIEAEAHLARRWDGSGRRYCSKGALKGGWGGLEGFQGGKGRIVEEDVGHLRDIGFGRLVRAEAGGVHGECSFLG